MPDTEAIAKAKRDSERRKALDDLARKEFEEGVYDRVANDPPDLSK